MNEPPDDRNEGAERRWTHDRLDRSEQDTATSVRINVGETEGVRADTDPESATTQVFANEYQKVLSERCRRIETVGRGGMAEARLNRRVAIEFLANLSSHLEYWAVTYSRLQV